MHLCWFYAALLYYHWHIIGIWTLVPLPNPIFSLYVKSMQGKSEKVKNENIKVERGKIMSE